VPSAPSAIHVVGSMMIDRVVRVATIPRPGETLAARSSATFAGGKGANQAAAAAKCGATVRMLGRGGRDSRFIVDALREAGVGTRAIALDDAEPGAATVMVADSGQNAIVIAPGANMRISARDIERFLEGARQGEIVLFQNECSCLLEGIAAAAARGLRVWLNAAPADARLGELRFEKLTGLVVNETEAEAMTGERDPARALETLARRMPGGTVIVTLGAQGAIAAVGSARYAHRGFVVDAVDTVGCGDAFVGAFLAGISAGFDITRALARGNAAGALAAMRAGAMPSLPEADEVAVAEVLPEGTRLKPRAGGAGGVPIRCEACDYPLSGSVLGDKCPECGRVITTAVFGGRWSSATPRRRFFVAAWVLAVSAAMFALGVAGMSVPGSALHFAFVRLAIIGLFASLATIPLSLFVLARNAASPSRGRLLQSIALIRAAALLLIVGLIALSVRNSQGMVWFTTAFGCMAACDALFAWWINDLCGKSAVRPVPALRRRGLAGLGALAAAVLVIRFGGGGVTWWQLAMLAMVNGWLAVEVLGIARRMRALEKA
jgi:ribokinase